jgi:hypothetical protein
MSDTLQEAFNAYWESDEWSGANEKDFVECGFEAGWKAALAAAPPAKQGEPLPARFADSIRGLLELVKLLRQRPGEAGINPDWLAGIIAGAEAALLAEQKEGEREGGARQADVERAISECALEVGNQYIKLRPDCDIWNFCQQVADKLRVAEREAEGPLKTPDWIKEGRRPTCPHPDCLRDSPCLIHEQAASRAKEREL